MRAFVPKLILPPFVTDPAQRKRVDFKSATSKVVCVGRNYVEHAKELNNPVPSEPLLFIKPTTSLVAIEKQVLIPQQWGGCHHELEVAVLIGNQLTCADQQQAEESIAGYGLALDLTLRDLQSQLKAKGQPWEKAKAFDGSCPLTDFFPVDFYNLCRQKTNFSLSINGELRQQGNTSKMIFPIADLISCISQHFTLLPGDIVLTGTPAGVGALHSGDQLSLYFAEHELASARVIQVGEKV